MKKLLYLIILLLVLCGCGSKPDIINTKYFQVEVPKSWENLYLYEIFEPDENVYSLVFYDKASHLSDFGGHVVTISVYYNKDEFDCLPSYEYLGEITNGSKSYHITTELPTDVQFDVSTQSTYTKLAESYESIIESVQFINGYQLVRD